MRYSVTVNIVTGFLGSGKTTMLKHVIATRLGNDRVAVIVNDVADLGVDGRLLQGEHIAKIVEVSGGCVCCSGILRLGLAVQEIMDTVRPAHLLIETSGVAEVRPLVSELRAIGLRTDSVITVVDAERILWSCAESGVAEEQVREADFLIINKIDLIDPGRLAQVKRRLQKLNPRGVVFEAAYGRIESDLPFASSVRRYRERTPGRATGRYAVNDGFSSFVYCRGGSFDRRRFERVLARLPREIYRSKGIVRVEGDARAFVFNYVCGRYELEPLSWPLQFDWTNQAVFIGRDVDRYKNHIVESLTRCAKG